MKFSWFLLLCVQFAAAADLTPRVGNIEIYGARKVSVQKIEKALLVKPGDLPPSREVMEDRVNKVPNIVVSRVEAACCTAGKITLYIGVQERDSAFMAFHPVPSGTVTLAPSVIANYRRFLDEVEDSIRGKNADEDLTNGYSLMADPDCRGIQTSFVTTVAADLPNVAKVVQDSADPEQRAAAAYLLQYAPRGPRTTPVMIDGVQWALQDDDDTVRANAMDSLRAIMVGAKLHPDQDIHIEPTWLVQLMNSVVYSDRVRASKALVALTDNGGGATLALLRERALPSVIEMARWQDLEKALPSFILAGRMAGLSQAQIDQAWVSNNRELVLAEVLKEAKHRKTKPETE